MAICTARQQLSPSRTSSHHRVSLVCKWNHESKFIFLILCGTDMNQPKLPVAASRCEARCCCSCFSSADRASCSFCLSWELMVADLGCSILFLDPKSNHMDFKWPPREWTWSHANQRFKFSRKHLKGMVTSHNDKNIFGFVSGNFIIFPLTWQLWVFYSPRAGPQSSRHVLHCSAIKEHLRREWPRALLPPDGLEKLNNQRQR